MGCRLTSRLCINIYMSPGLALGSPWAHTEISGLTMRKQKFWAISEIADVHSDLNTSCIVIQHLLVVQHFGVSSVMTTACQKYYTKNILPTYICAIHKACTQGNGLEPWMLQEDNNPSHGNGPRSL